MEANENSLQNLRPDEGVPPKGAQKGFFSWLRVHIFDWWMRLLILFLLMLGIGIASLLSGRCIKSFSSFEYLLIICGVVFLLSLANIILCIADLCKKHFKKGIIGLVITLFLGWLIGSMGAAIANFIARGGPGNGWVGDLKPPEDIELAEPLEPLDPFYSGRSYKDVSEDSFQYQVIKSLVEENTLDENAVCRIPALEKLSSTPEGRERLIRYLSFHPEWRVFRLPDSHGKRGLLYAVRCFCIDGKVYEERDNYYKERVIEIDKEKFGKNFENLKKWTYRFGIGLDGESFFNEKGMQKNSTKTTLSKDLLYIGSVTEYSAGKFVFDIFEYSRAEGHPMTAKTLELAKKEFSVLLSEDPEAWRKSLPTDAIRKDGQADITLYRNSYLGMYNADVWCNPGEPGFIYLKAFEITQGTPLSGNDFKSLMRKYWLTAKTSLVVDSLEDETNVKTGYSKDPSELFFAPMRFTIYEGNWGRCYGARFEVWFKPDSGQPERKLLEKNFEIGGWEE